jgi:hypothetical protein
MMKSKLLLSLIFLFLFNVGKACPSWRIGNMVVVDEQGRPLPKTVVWKYTTLLDSHQMRKNRQSGEEDTNSYSFWSHMGWSDMDEEAKPANKYLRIQAEGYADVIIKALDFHRSYNREDNRLPTIYVTMYPKKYLTKGDLMTRIDEYVCDKLLKVSDSLRIGMTDYMEKYRSENAVDEASRNAGFIVKAYPNPVIDKLHVQIHADMVKPYLAKVLDMQGKLVSETRLDNSLSEIDLEWESSGLYLVSVYNPEGELLYALKFSKS